ncbi:hypothetical protein [Rhodococcus ruber]
MRINSDQDIAEAIGALQRDRLYRVTGTPQPVEDDRDLLTRYLDTLPDPDDNQHQAPVVPLNGAGVLRAALAGAHGTINGGTRETVQSAAEVIRQELGGVSGRMDATG